MKKIYPYFNILISATILLFFLLFSVGLFRDNTIRDIVAMTFFLFLSVAILGLYITYDDVSYTLHLFFFKKKVFYSDIKFVCWAGFRFPSLYTIWANSKSLNIFLPFCRKQTEAFFNTIQKANPSVNIDVWWYKKGKSEITKNISKDVLFVVVVIVICLLFYFATGINLVKVLRKR